MDQKKKDEIINYLNNLSDKYEIKQIQFEQIRQIQKNVLNDQEINAYNLKIEANEYFKQEKYMKAIEIYKLAVQQNKEEDQQLLSQLYFNTALCYKHLNNIENTKIYLQKALEINPEYKKAQIILSTIEQ